jgi:predicted nucleic acid binding AN1-type Zn finger protein
MCKALPYRGNIYLFIYSNNHIIYRNVQICNFIFSKKKIVKENKKISYNILKYSILLHVIFELIKYSTDVC